jgi:nitrate/nitrite transport system substrate-binding protein
MRITFARAAMLAAALLVPALYGPVEAETLGVEKPHLKLGFIKLTDMAPLAIAYEKGFFEDEGLLVTLEPQADWKALLDRVIDGELDGAHMLAGQPLAATIGCTTCWMNGSRQWTQAPIVTPLSMDLNGNGITVSNEVWAMMKPGLPMGPDGRPQHPIKADYLKPVIEKFREAGRPFKMGMVSPVSTHNYELRYWLAAAGLHPGYYSPNDVSGQIAADVLLSLIPPPQMPAALKTGTINGYCVGEPWNQQAVFESVGVPVITDYEIWKNSPEKVFGLRADFVERYPNTALALTKALIRAAIWLDADGNANRGEAAKILARPEYVGADAEVIARSMTGTFEYEKGDRRAVPDFNVFFRYFTTYPYYSDAVWYLTQMRRWGQITEAKPDAWYVETVAKVYRPDLYLQAARLLVKEGKAEASDFPWDSDGYRAPQAKFIDGVVFDGHGPNEYLAQFAIGLKSGQRIENGRLVTSGP